MKNTENQVQSGSTIKYFCPMKCEGDKTYDKPGKCPVCHMNLIAGNQDDHPEHIGHPEHQKHLAARDEHNKTGDRDKYYCTMLCEGDKTYPGPGDCPVCGMHLKKIEVATRSIPKPSAIYTCPMHPQVKQNKPGSCPICGMDLVPEKYVE